MTNIIRCDCGFVAREANEEEARKDAVIHINQFHPDFELQFSDVCWLIETEDPSPDLTVPMGSGINDEFVEATFLY